MRTNYHSHTWRCKHAQGTEEEMVRAALKSGFTDLGFSDHAPWPFPDGFVSGCRMHAEQLPDYVTTIQGLREQYKGQIRIYIGLEAEYYPSMMGWMREMKEQYGLYLNMGDHFEDEPGFYFGSCANLGEMNRYLDRVIAGLETGLYTYLAHPDLFLNSFTEFTKDCEDVSRQLCRACKAMNIPLEYNLLGATRQPGRRKEGFWGYSAPEFYRVAAEEGVPCIVGVDAHEPERLMNTALYDESAAWLRSLGLHVINGQELAPFRVR